MYVYLWFSLENCIANYKRSLCLYSLYNYVVYMQSQNVLFPAGRPILLILFAVSV